MFAQAQSCGSSRSRRRTRKRSSTGETSKTPPGPLESPSWVLSWAFLALGPSWGPRGVPLLGSPVSGLSCTSLEASLGRLLGPSSALVEDTEGRERTPRPEAWKTPPGPLFNLFWTLSGPLLGRRGSSWAPLGGLIGVPRRVPEGSRRGPGALWLRSRIVGLSWTSLGGPLGLLLGPSWASLGAPLGPLVSPQMWCKIKCLSEPSSGGLGSLSGADLRLVLEGRKAQKH